MRNAHILLFENLANVCEVIGLVSILTMALLLEFVLGELPCPLCLLQRIGFYFMIFGFMLNLRFGFRPSHYAIVILSGLFTSFVAMRQIALHIIPGSGAYGEPILGFHLYTWVFIITMIITIMTTLLLSIDRQYNTFIQKKSLTYYSKFLFIIVIVTIIINIVSVFMECGFEFCPDNPVHFKYNL